MITVIVQDCNNFSQDFYDSVVRSIQMHQLKCSCGHSACLHIHGYYKREVHSSAGCYTLCIQRVKCTECGRTHAILLSSIVPYQQIALEDQRITVQAFEEHGDTMQACTPSDAIDENNVKSIIRRYRRHWREKLRSEGISLDGWAGLVRGCFACFSAQFMQIHRSQNSLFPNTT